MPDWPIYMQLILQGGALGILALFLLVVFPRMHREAVTTIAKSQQDAATLFLGAIDNERRALTQSLKDHAAAVREQSQRLDRLAMQAVCRYPNRRDHGPKESTQGAGG